MQAAVSSAGPVTAFVLGGGGSLSAMQAGMVHALYERNIVPDLLIGTSAGALNAAFLASRPPTTATAQELAGIWRQLRRKDVFPLRPQMMIPGLAGRKDHLFPNQGLRDLAARHLQFQRLEQASIPLHLIAADLNAGQEVRISHGPAIDAVLGAAAIPGALPPVHWLGRLLADGAIVNNTPISHAIQLGAQQVYVLPTGLPDAPDLAEPPRTALSATLRAVGLLANARLRDDLARYRTTAELIVLPAPNPQHIEPTDFTHADQLITSALTASRSVLTSPTAAPPSLPTRPARPHNPGSGQTGQMSRASV
jgi:NTE family protein